MDRIKIDNQDFTNCVDGIHEFSISYGFNAENQTVSYGTSNDLILYNEAHDYIKAGFLDDCTRIYEVEVYIECCKRVFNFIIDPDDITACLNSCQTKVSLTTTNDDIIAYDCLNSQIWLSDDFLYNQNNLWFNNNQNGVTEDNRWFTGYLVREVLAFHAQRCGIQLDAAIFTDPSSPYFHLAIIPQGESSSEYGLPSNVNLLQNTTETTIELLDRLKKVFNAEYEIINGVLRFDRQDRIGFNTVDVLDIKDAITEEDICYQLVKGDNCAYARISWATDASDNLTSRNLYLKKYKDLIPFNGDVPNPALKGACRYEFDFATVEASPASGGGFAKGGILINSVDISVDRLVIWNGINRDFSNVDVHPSCGDNGGSSIQQALQVRELSNCPNLWSEYFEYTRPRKGGLCRKELKDFCYMPQDFCESVDKILSGGVGIGLDTEIGLFSLNRTNGEISIDFGNKTICVSALDF